MNNLVMRRALVSLWVLVLCACATMFVPKTPAELIGVADASIAALAVATKQQLDAGVIPKEKAAVIKGVLENGYTASTLAKNALAQGNPTSAMGYLDLVSSILSQVQVTLGCKLQKTNAPLTGASDLICVGGK